MKTLFVALGIMLVAAGCGKEVTPTITLLGHIQGTFILQAGPTPTCAAAPAPSTCERFTQPIAGAAIKVLDSTGHTVTTALTNSGGVFLVSLGQGTYTVMAPQASEPGTYRQTVVLAAGGTVSVTLDESEP
jgi:Carboxypeptidase regulatory-like domain